MKTTVGDRLYVFALISAFLVVLTFQTQEDREEHRKLSRTNQELCAEVAKEVNIQVGEGMLTQEQADATIERCYNLFIRRDQ